MTRRQATIAAAMAALLSISGCGGSGPSGSSSGSPTATPSATTTPGPSASSSTAAFTLEVVPDRFIGKSIGGQRVLLLVRVSGDPGDGAVTLRAEAAGAGGAAVEVEPAQLAPGTIGEVLVVPAPISGEADLTVTVTASRDGQEQRIERTVPIVEGSDGDAQTARAYLDRFVPWLATTHPELGISEGTVWQGTPGSWVLIVTHYVFISADWEVDLAWHVMTPPNDWIRIQLRHRWSESVPSIAFEIPSAAGSDPPRQIAPDAAVWR